MKKTVLICDFCGFQSVPTSGEFCSFEEGSKGYPPGWGVLETADKSGNGEWDIRHVCPSCLEHIPYVGKEGE